MPSGHSSSWAASSPPRSEAVPVVLPTDLVNAADRVLVRDTACVPRIASVLLALGLAAILAACGGSKRSSQPTRAGGRGSSKPSPRRFLRVDGARRAVELTLIAADGAGNNGFNFDGYGRGELLVRVPQGWRVTVQCRNAGSVRNSCAVVSRPAPMTLAFPGASTASPVTGLRGGESASFSFTAARVGSYRFASLVSGHEQARMWDVLEVTRGGRPSISARSGP
jgi:hypothetical protein